MRLALVVTLLACSVSLAQTTQPDPSKSKRYVSNRPEPDADGRMPLVGWCAGTVRDEAGQPLADVTVYAYTTYHGGIRMYEDVRSATTDAAGKYEIRGEGYRSSFSGTVVAFAPRRAPAIAWLQLPQPRITTVEEGQPLPPLPEPPPPTRIDLTMPAGDARAEITVLRDGEPAAGVAVQLRPQGLDLRDHWALGGGEVSRAAQAAFYPVRITGDGGVARFEGLLPGLYQVFAHEGDEQANRAALYWGRVQRTDKPLGESIGLPLRLGETTRHCIAIYPQPQIVRMRVIPVDGHPIRDEQVPIQWAPWQGGGWSSTAKITEGVISQRADGLGITRIAAQYQDEKTGWIPLKPPFYEALVMAAVSSRLTYETPLEVKAKRVDGGRLVVKLLDATDKPTAGTVELTEAGGRDVKYSADADANGVATFEKLPQYPWIVRQAGRPPAGFDQTSKTFPADEDLVGQLMALPQRVPVSNGRTATATLRPAPVGYVRAKLHRPAGTGAQDYAVYLGGSTNPATQMIFDAEKGEYLFGPLPPGPTQLRVCQHPSGRPVLVDIVPVDVRADAAATVQITPPNVPRKDDGEASVMLDMGGVLTHTGGSRLLGTVTLADGRTPALGAAVYVIDPGDHAPSVTGYTDALGRIRERNFSYYHREGADRPGTPTKRVAAAILPGLAGATVQELPLGAVPELKLKLPPPRSLRGTVTIGGKPARDQKGRIRVLARHEGLGNLDGLLSVRTTAAEDGSYELAGLTPGKYTVQAALDDVWLSASRPLEVRDQPFPMTLAIGEPGPPIDVQLTAEADLTIDRPPGPLQEELWPESFRPDGAGVVHVPAVEAGEHVLHIGEKLLRVTVPRLTETQLPVEADVKP